MALKPYLQKFSQKKDLQKIEFHNFRDDLFLSLFSIPIYRKDDFLGMAHVLYDLSQDKHLLQRILGKSNAKLLIQTPGHLVDISTDQSRTLTGEITDLTVKGSDHLLEGLFPGENIIPLEIFPGLFYAASSEPLQKEKSSLIFKLVFLCAGIFILTLLVSFLIVRKVSNPLESWKSPKNLQALPYNFKKENLSILSSIT